MVRRIGSELVSNSGPGFGIDQRRMLAGVELTLVRNPTAVDRVREEPVDMPARKGLATALGAACSRATLRPRSEAVGFFLDPADGAEIEIKGEDMAHRP